MTSESSAEPTTSTPGPSDSSIAGVEAHHISTAQMDIGRLGIDRGLGCFEHDLIKILTHSGMSWESIQDTVPQITMHVSALLQAALALYISDIANPKTEPKKPESTATSGS